MRTIFLNISSKTVSRLENHKVWSNLSRQTQQCCHYLNCNQKHNNVVYFETVVYWIEILSLYHTKNWFGLKLEHITKLLGRSCKRNIVTKQIQTHFECKIFDFPYLNILNSIFECEIYAILFRMPEGTHFILVVNKTKMKHTKAYTHIQKRDHFAREKHPAKEERSYFNEKKKRTKNRSIRMMKSLV